MRPRWAAWAFAIYAVVLFLGTHWPQLRVEGPVPRPDLIVHLLAFGLWTVLLGACQWWGPWRGVRNAAITWAVAIVYAAIDEALQLIPALGRFAAWDDYAANVLGVTAGAIALVIIGRVRPAAGASR